MHCFQLSTRFLNWYLHLCVRLLQSFFIGCQIKDSSDLADLLRQYCFCSGHRQNKYTKNHKPNKTKKNSQNHNSQNKQKNRISYLKSTGFSLDGFSVCFYRYAEFLSIYLKSGQVQLLSHILRLFSIGFVTDLVWTCSLHHTESIKHWKLRKQAGKREGFFVGWAAHLGCTA